MKSPPQRPDREQLTDIADQSLVRRARDGDPMAFEALIRRHGPLMRAYIARIVGSRTEADDVAQEAFYSAWRWLPELRDPAAVRPWLMRIAGRHAFSYLRRRPVASRTNVDTPVPASDQPENVAERNAVLQALSSALEALPADQRQCWLLREVGKFSYEEIAEELNIPTTAVRGKLARGRANVCARMEGWR